MISFVSCRLGEEKETFLGFPRIFREKGVMTSDLVRIFRDYR